MRIRTRRFLGSGYWLHRLFLTLVLSFLFANLTLGDTLYVSQSGTHQPPYANWVTAATNIQDAIDEAMDGDTVLVTNGVYDAGGVIVHGLATNRIAVTNAITLRSVNGPEGTLIVGSGPMGSNAVRCAYIGDGARLEGFTLTNGHTRTYGVWDTEASGGGAWCEVTAIVSNCTIIGNSAWSSGGGTYGGMVQNCTVSENTSRGGGGTAFGTIQNCVIEGNSAEPNESYGGGTFYGTIQNCTIAGNSASRNGGGTYAGTIRNSTITGNSADLDGGGTSQGTVENCTIVGNSATRLGGGTSAGTIENCTIMRNSAFMGGGTAAGTVRNCIVYYNSAGAQANCRGSTVKYTCTIPDPGGAGNITNAPGLAGLGNPHIVASSPCIDAGTNLDWMATAVDIDGEPRIGDSAVDMGCDEFYEGGATGTLTVAILTDYTNAAVGVPVGCVADIQGRPTSYQWLWGDGGISSNTPCTSHTYSSPGAYTVVLEAWNVGGSTSATLTVHVVAGYTNYVSLSGSHIAPYETWTTAATNIQAAIDVQTIVGGVVLVTNGTYDTGGVVVHGSMTNRIAIVRPVTVRSVNGPGSTWIVGEGPRRGAAARCAYVGHNARLEGFTLSNGHTRDYPGDYTEQSGGGARCESSAVVSNCTIIGNSAGRGGGASNGTIQDCAISGNAASSGGGTQFGTIQNCTISGNSASRGGGAYYSTVQNSTILGNSASYSGGGTFNGTIQNCTITHNTAKYSGGTDNGAIQNCIVYYNAATNSGDNCRNDFGTVDYTCTTPDPGGVGNITNEPEFVDISTTNLRLLCTSSCIDSGSNQAWMGGVADLEGSPRIINGTVDMGAYEYIHSPSDYDGDGLSNEDETGVYLTDPTLDDTDMDGMVDGAEVVADTDPLNPSSLLQILGVSREYGGTRIEWHGGTWAWQFLEVCEDLSDTNAPWATIYGLPPPTPTTNAIIDYGTEGDLLYRIRADQP